MRFVFALIALSSVAARAEGPLVPREPFAKAHVQMMARAEEKGGEARMVDVELWAEGTRLRALVHGEKVPTELWVSGLAQEPVVIKGAKPFEPRKRTLEHGLAVGLRPSASLANSKGDRVAGKPCKVISEQLEGGLSLTRCIWSGVPLSIELSGKGFSFNAAAVLVEEGNVTVADLQPPLGAPAAPPSMSASTH